MFNINSLDSEANLIREESEDNTDMDDDTIMAASVGTTVSRLKDRWEQLSIAEAGTKIAIIYAFHKNVDLRFIIFCPLSATATATTAAANKAARLTFHHRKIVAACGSKWLRVASSARNFGRKRCDQVSGQHCACTIRKCGTTAKRIDQEGGNNEWRDVGT